LHARIDAGQNHRLIVPLSRERDVWNEPEGRSTYGDSPYKVPAIEFAVEKTSATRAGSLTSNHLQCRHCPSLGGDLTISNFCGSISVHAHTTHARPTKVRNRYRRRERDRARLDQLCRAPLQHLVGVSVVGARKPIPVGADWKPCPVEVLFRWALPTRSPGPFSVLATLALKIKEC